MAPNRLRPSPYDFDLLIFSAPAVDGESPPLEPDAGEPAKKLGL